MPNAADIIARLDLQPHPEGGHYRETFRDSHVDANGRVASTAILFLLARGERSHWHRIDAVEVWHYHAGDPLELSLHREGHGVTRHMLGVDLAANQRPQIVVPAGWWQTATSLGDWTLVGCTVAPGFNFGAFEMAAPGWQPS